MVVDPDGVILTANAEGCVTVVVEEEVHPGAAVTTTEYVPAVNPLTEDVVAPLDHEYVYGDVPPVTDAKMEPLEPPAQVTLVVVNTTDRLEGWLMVVVAVVLHPPAEVTVTV